MTQKDYRLIAESIDAQQSQYNKLSPEYIALRLLAQRLCGVLRKDNPRFNEDIFLKACGF